MAMIVRFIARDGTATTTVATPGDRLLNAAQAHNQPLEGTCEGQLACATCHVIVDPADFARLPPATEDEIADDEPEADEPAGGEGGEESEEDEEDRPAQPPRPDA